MTTVTIDGGGSSAVGFVAGTNAQNNQQASTSSTLSVAGMVSQLENAGQGTCQRGVVNGRIFHVLVHACLSILKTMHGHGAKPAHGLSSAAAAQVSVSGKCLGCKP